MIDTILNIIKNSCALSDEVTQDTNFIDLSLILQVLIRSNRGIFHCCNLRKNTKYESY